MNYVYNSRFGTFTIMQKNNRWHIVFDGENLGSYATPEQALDDLVGGHTYWPSNGIDPSECGLPDELSAWSKSR